MTASRTARLPGAVAEVLRREPAPSARMILGEGALRRPVPDAKVWADQLAHLLEASERGATDCVEVADRILTSPTTMTTPEDAYYPAAALAAKAARW